MREDYATARSAAKEPAGWQCRGSRKDDDQRSEAHCAHERPLALDLAPALDPALLFLLLSKSKSTIKSKQPSTVRSGESSMVSFSRQIP